MTLEQSLAARKISHMVFTLGLGRETAILGATRLLVSQGFGEEYSRKVATEMADLVI